VAGDNTILSKTICAGTPREARVIYNPDSGLMVTANPSAPGFGTALGGGHRTSSSGSGSEWKIETERDGAT